MLTLCSFAKFVLPVEYERSGQTRTYSGCLFRTHVQASVWLQDLVVDPVVPDPVMRGWQMQDGNLLPVLTNEAQATEAVRWTLRLNQPAIVHADVLANETILSAPNCAIVPTMTSITTQSQPLLYLV